MSRTVSTLRSILLTLLVALAGSASALAEVGPLLQTTWGQGGDYQSRTPIKDGERTYPGCTTIATAQILYHYQYTDTAESDVAYRLDHSPLRGPDIDGRTLSVDLTDHRYDYSAMAADLDGASARQIEETATFIYHVGVSLNAQFGGGMGSSATAKQLENAFRYQWGYNNIARRRMSIIAKDAFGYRDATWAALIRSELDAGRVVLYMALEMDGPAGHAFVIDGYDDAGLVHVNWGWGGYASGWYDPNTLEDPSGRQWVRNPLIFRGLEPERGYAAEMNPSDSAPTEATWNGAFSMIDYTSGQTKGYGLNLDEARLSETTPVSFLQWELDPTSGSRVEISADVGTRATITYGLWSDRSEDRVYRDVALPFVLDPAADGFEAHAGSYFTIAVALPDPHSPVSVTARATKAPGSGLSSHKAEPTLVDGGVWHGNGSLISYSSGKKTGYGLTRDEARIHPSDAAPRVFFQWEIDGRDGRRLLLDAPGMARATVTYGRWNDRSRDLVHEVALPYTLDPVADGLAADDGAYYVIKVAFEDAPETGKAVTAEIVD